MECRNTDALETMYVPESWESRSTGTVAQGTIRIPNDFTLPDASVGNTPNNPTIFLNLDTYGSVCMNGTARPVAGGNLYGYKDDTNPRTHGGSGTIGGQILQSELDAGTIGHAIAINVYGRDWLDSSGLGYEYPATKADENYANSGHGDYYGRIPADPDTSLVMGSRLGIPRSVSAESLGITSAAGRMVYEAAVTYGLYIVDNTKIDALSWNTDANAAVTLAAVETELRAILGAGRKIRIPS